MSDTKQNHTPGPWKVHDDMDGRHRGYAILSEAPEFTTTEDWPYHPRIAKAECGWGSAPKDIAQANARLISAAPDMKRCLVASDAMLRMLYEFLTSEQQKYVAEQIEINEAAIARAEGRE